MSSTGGPPTAGEMRIPFLLPVTLRHVVGWALQPEPQISTWSPMTSNSGARPRSSVTKIRGPMLRGPRAHAPTATNDWLSVMAMFVRPVRLMSTSHSSMVCCGLGEASAPSSTATGSRVDPLMTTRGSIAPGGIGAGALAGPPPPHASPTHPTRRPATDARTPLMGQDCASAARRFETGNLVPPRSPAVAAGPTARPGVARADQRHHSGRAHAGRQSDSAPVTLMFGTATSRCTTFRPRTDCIPLRPLAFSVQRERLAQIAPSTRQEFAPPKPQFRFSATLTFLERDAPRT